VFADLGNRIVCLDIQEDRIANLNQGILPIYEPGLEEMVARNVKAGRLSFTTSYAEGIKDAEFVFISVGTPSDVDGEADLQYVRAAAESVAEVMDHPLIIVFESGAVGTGDWVADIIKGKQRRGAFQRRVMSVPARRSAIGDFLNPTGPCSVRPGGGGSGGAASPAAARPNHGHGPAHGGNDQVCLECFPGDQDQFHQRDRQYLRRWARTSRKLRRAWALTSALAPP
jgi:hypothetical protein